MRLQGLLCSLLILFVFFIGVGKATWTPSSGTCVQLGQVTQCPNPRWYSGSTRVVNRCLAAGTSGGYCYLRGICSIWCNAAGYGGCVGYLEDTVARATQYPDGSVPGSNGLGFQWMMCVTVPHTSITRISPSVQSMLTVDSYASLFKATCVPSTTKANQVVCSKITYTSGNRVDACYYPSYAAPNVYLLCAAPTETLVCAGLGYGGLVSATTAVYSTTQYPTGSTCNGACTAIVTLTCSVAVALSITPELTATREVESVSHSLTLLPPPPPVPTSPGVPTASSTGTSAPPSTAAGGQPPTSASPPFTSLSTGAASFAPGSPSRTSQASSTSPPEASALSPSAPTSDPSGASPSHNNGTSTTAATPMSGTATTAPVATPPSTTTTASPAVTTTSPTRAPASDSTTSIPSASEVPATTSSPDASLPVCPAVPLLAWVDLDVECACGDSDSAIVAAFGRALLAYAINTSTSEPNRTCLACQVTCTSQPPLSAADVQQLASALPLAISDLSSCTVNGTATAGGQRQLRVAVSDSRLGGALEALLAGNATRSISTCVVAWLPAPADAGDDNSTPSFLYLALACAAAAALLLLCLLWVLLVRRRRQRKRKEEADRKSSEIAALMSDQRMVDPSKNNTIFATEGSEELTQVRREDALLTMAHSTDALSPPLLANDLAHRNPLHRIPQRQ